MTSSRPHEPPWLSLSEAAALTGLDREAVRSLVGRGLIPHMVDDRGRRLVRIPLGSVTADDRARSAGSNATLGEEVAALREELARTRERADRLQGELCAVLGRSDGGAATDAATARRRRVHANRAIAQKCTY